MSAKPVGSLFRGLSLLVRVVVGLGILAGGVAIAAALVATRPVTPRAARGPGFLQVRTMPVVLADVARSWEGYGTARAMHAAQIPAQVSATVILRPLATEPGLTAHPPERPLTLPEDVDIRSDALLSSLLAWGGDRVLLRLDPSDYASRLDSAVDQAQATRAQLDALDIQDARTRETLALAVEERQIQERELERAITAEAQGGGNTTEIERRRASLLLARRLETQLLEELEQIDPRRAELRARLRDQSALVDVARQNLARTIIVSPIAGTLQEVMAEQGEWVQAGTAVARVVDLSRVEVPLRVPVEAAGSIAVGDPALLTADTRTGRRWEGRVVRLAPEIDPSTRTVTAFVEVDQDPSSLALLRPGQFVVGTITTRSTTPALLVPRRIVIDDRVFVVESGDPDSGDQFARALPVTPMFTIVGTRSDLDPVEDQWAALLPGQALAPGRDVIVSNLDDLRDGLLIRAADPPPPPTAANPPARPGDAP